MTILSQLSFHMINTLVAGPRYDPVYLWMTDGLASARKDLQKKLGLQLRSCDSSSFNELQAAIARQRPQLLLLSYHWKTPVDEVIRILQRLSEQDYRPKIVYMDYYDQSSTPFFPILPWVDLFWRKQLLTPLESYNSIQLAGGNHLADLAARLYGADIGDWHFGSKIPSGYEDRIGLGWNLATQSKIGVKAKYPLLRSLKIPTRRNIDVFCRVSTRSVSGGNHKDIYSLHRIACLEALEALRPKYRIE